MSGGFYFGVEIATIFMISIIFCGLILRFRRLHIHRSVRSGDLGAVQSAHMIPTPRIGGVALGCAIVATIAFAPQSLKENYFLFSLSILPVFVIGLCEDLGYRMSARRRLLAAATSSAVAIYLLNVWISRLDFPGLDIALGWAPVGIILTIIATAGVCNAFNLIDGLNGLSSGTATLTGLGLAAMSGLAGDQALVELNLMLVAALFGFMVFNYPWGKLFLGAAGAYSLGYILSWSAIALLVRAPDVAAWAILLLFFWPVADTMLAIYRRRAAGLRSDQADRLHYHHVVMRGLEILWLGRGQRKLTNPVATLVMMPFIAAPVITGVLLWDKPLWSFVAVLGFAALFVTSYLIGVRAIATRMVWGKSRNTWPHVPGE